MKINVLEALQNAGTTYVSGEQLSEQLGVSRTMIWKIINQLKSEGYEIESSSRKGYRLKAQNERMTQASLSLLFKNQDWFKKVVYHEVVDSTNLEAKRLALDTEENPILIVADEQQLGRGRLGRSWHSAKGDGLWMSLLIRPEIEPEASFRLTLIGAVAVVKAIEKVTSLSAGIKWPNDVIVNDKKICGILSEMSAEWQKVNYVVLGIGINVNQGQFPDEIVEKASSLAIESQGHVNKLDLLYAFAEAYMYFEQALYNQERLSELLAIYREKSVTIGKTVKVIGKSERIGKALEIDDKGALLVAFEDGETTYVNYGEVSVRGIDYYV